MMTLACQLLGQNEACDPPGADRTGSTGACIAFAAPQELGRIQEPSLIEASGLVASRAHPGVFYSHNDSGDIARFFALDVTGRALGEFDLAGLTMNDWEDVALGPSRGGGDVLYFGDIGDNSLVDPNVAPRSGIVIVRVREPIVSPNQAAGVQSLSGWERLLLVYPDGPHDAETLMADPGGGELWIVTKSPDGHSSLYGVPADTPAETLTALTKLGDVRLSACEGAQVTAGDISFDGRLVLLRTYQGLLLWERVAGTPLAQTLQSPPHPLRAAVEAQGEGVAFSADAKAWFSVGEGVGAPIFGAPAECR